MSRCQAAATRPRRRHAPSMGGGLSHVALLSSLVVALILFKNLRLFPTCVGVDQVEALSTHTSCSRFNLITKKTWHVEANGASVDLIKAIVCFCNENRPQISADDRDTKYLLLSSCFWAAQYEIRPRSPSPGPGSAPPSCYIKGKISSNPEEHSQNWILVQPKTSDWREPCGFFSADPVRLRGEGWREDRRGVSGDVWSGFTSGLCIWTVDVWADFI